MNVYRKIDARVMPWFESEKSHVTHALVAGTQGDSDFEIFKTARSEQEANLYLENFRKYGAMALLPSEVSKYLNLIWQYLEKPCLDLGSGGYPVSDFAIQVEQDSEGFNHYTGGRQPDIPLQMHADIFNLPFKDGTVGSVVSSHVIEDWPRDRWPGFFKEWERVLRPGGYLIVLVPERSRWWHCVNEFGQCHNFSHAPGEPLLGDITEAAKGLRFNVLFEKLTEAFQWDYSILAVLQKT